MALIAMMNDKVKQLMLRLRDMIFFNFLIRCLTIAYIKMCITCGSRIKNYMVGDSKTIYSDYAIGCVLFTALIVYILVSWIVIQYFKPRLDEDRIKRRIGNFYNDLKMKLRMDSHLLYYPMFLFRRVIFVAIPTFISKYPYYQIQILISLTTLYIIYYAGSQPHTPKERVWIEIFNEWWILVMTYHLIIFSEFVLDLEI